MVPTDTQLPGHFRLEEVIRTNILSLKPYRCARDDYDAGILLDANENSLGSALAPVALGEEQGLLSKPGEEAMFNLRALSLHRYPSPSQIPIKQNLCDYRNATHPALPPLEPSNVFLGVGSDEILDLVVRIACRPGDSEHAGDHVVITPPTYGMYSVCAKVNDVGVIHVPLDVQDGAFTVDLQKLDERLSQQSRARPIKLIILCSPGNPTGTTVPIKTIEAILSNPTFNGILVVDEAYIDFAGNEKSAIQLVRRGWKNLMVTQTMSKGFGLAGIRLGIAYGPADLIQVLNNTKAPYTISSPTSLLGYHATTPESLRQTERQIEQIVATREWLKAELGKLEGLGEILGGNEANFLLVQVLASSPSLPSAPDNQRAKKIYQFMAQDSHLVPPLTPVVVRYRGDEVGCHGCLRITVGTRDQSQKLIQKLRDTLKIIL